VAAAPDRHDGTQDFTSTASRVLAHLREQFGLDTWALGRRREQDWVALAASGLPLPVTEVPWSATLCHVVESGQADWLTTDIDSVPALARARDGLALRADSFVTIPLRDATGTLLGTICGYGHGPVRIDPEVHRPLLDTLSDVLGALLAAELRVEREARRREAAETDAQTDALTGLGNRRHWDRALTAEDDRCQRLGSPAAVLTIDVDGLKRVNDLWGHDGGDRLLRTVAEVLRAECRPQDVVARVGGDEFGVLLAEVAAPAAEAVASRLRAALDNADAASSVGMAMRDVRGLSAAWRQADAQMYLHKRAHAPLPETQPVAPMPSIDLSDESVVTQMLSLVLDQTSADIAFIGRFEGPNRIMRAVRSVAPLDVTAGHTELLETTYCDKIVRGELPSAIPDTSLNEVAAALPVTEALPIGAYLGVPLHLSDGRLYGTLCCLSHTPRPSYDESAVAVLHHVGRGLTRVLTSEESERHRRRGMLAAIDEVVEHQRVEVVFQPVVELASGALRGVEALSRFDDGRGPDQWFADAAHVGRTTELELHAARAALDAAGGWPTELWLNLSASVLLSPRAADLLAGRDLARLVVEISEHEEIRDYVALRKVLAPLRAQGLRLAVDDAGAGFASLRHVLELRPEVIKLDLSLVQGLPDDPQRAALVTALVAFAGQVGADVVAEGVETAAVLLCLQGYGVTLAQGNHLSAPVTTGGLQPWFARRAPVSSG
jgi:diguanylate cyclase (GGDEF)-like protein